MTVFPVWIEAILALLLVLSGAFAVIGALGLIVLKNFFHRMHPPALANTLAGWSITLASIIYFSMLESQLDLRNWVVIILLAITAPVTTVLLARAGLFRKREASLQTEVPQVPEVPGPPKS
jgi:multicomponent K+:H+ antiporter subunit G